MFSPPTTWGAAPELPSKLLRFQRSHLGSYQPNSRPAFRPGGTDIDSRLAKDRHSVLRLSVCGSAGAAVPNLAAFCSTAADANTIIQRQPLAGSPVWPKKIELFGSSTGAIQSSHSDECATVQPQQPPRDELCRFASSTGHTYPSQAHISIQRRHMHEPKIDPIRQDQPVPAATPLIPQLTSQMVQLAGSGPTEACTQALSGTELQCSEQGSYLSLQVPSNAWTSSPSSVPLHVRYMPVTGSPSSVSEQRSLSRQPPHKHASYRPYTAASRANCSGGTRSKAKRGLTAKAATAVPAAAAADGLIARQSAWGAERSRRDELYPRYPYCKSEMARHEDNQLPTEAYKTESRACDDPTPLALAIAQFQSDFTCKSTLKTRGPSSAPSIQPALHRTPSRALRGNRYSKSEMTKHFDTSCFAAESIK